MNKIVLVGVVTLLVSGCATQTFNINGGNDGTPSTDKMQPFFVAGIGQEQHADAANICGGANNIAKVQTEDAPLNILLRIVTFGIYTPRQARVYCKR